MYPGNATKNVFEPKKVIPIHFRENDNSKSQPHESMPAVNISEFVSEYCIQIAVPGLHREDFNIELKDGVIFISAQKNTVQHDCINDRCEFDYQDWTRAFILPADADSILAQASYKNGELLIRIPRTQPGENKASVTVYVY